MGFIQLIDTIIKANLPVSYQDQPNYAELTYNSLTRQGVSSPFDTLNFQALYSLNSDVYAAVNTIATKLAQLPFKVTVPRGDELEDITDSPDLDIFRTLNGRDTDYDFYEQTWGNTEITGEVFWLLNYDNAGNKITEMAVLRPDLIEPVPHNEFVISHYIFNRNGEKIIIPHEFIFHIKYFNPLNSLRGLSPLEAAKQDIILDAFALTASKTTFKKGARPSGILAPKGDTVITDTEIKRNLAFINDQYTGADTFGTLLLLSKGLEFQQMQYSNKDLMYDVIRDATSDTVGKVFGVPPIYRQDYSDASVIKNAEVQFRMLWEALKPKTVKLGKIITEHLLPLIIDKPGAVFTFDLNDVPALQPDRLKLKAIFADRTAISANEYREHVAGLPRDDDPNMDLKYIPQNMIPIGTVIEEPEKSLQADAELLVEHVDQLLLKEPQMATDVLLKDIKLLTESMEVSEQKSEISRTFLEINKIRRKVGREFEKKLAKLFKDQGDAVVKSLINQKHFKFAEGDILFNFNEWVKKYEAEGKIHIAEAIRLAGEQFANSIGEDFNVFDPKVVSHIGTKSKSYATIVNQTTKDRIDALIKQGVEKGLSVSELAESLTGYFDSAEGFRAVRIAQTEVNSAVNFGRLEGMRQSKRVEKHRWVSSRDEDVRDLPDNSHVNLDNKIVKLGDSFPVGASYSGDSTYPSDVNERCITTPVTIKKKPKQ